MELRKYCIHLYLIKGAEEKIIGDYFKRNSKLRAEELTVINPISPLFIGEYTLNDSDEYHKIMIQSSRKLVLLDMLLQKLKGQHKILILR